MNDTLEAHKDLQKKIQQAIEEFEKKTGYLVMSDIQVSRAGVTDGQYIYGIHVAIIPR